MSCVANVVPPVFSAVKKKLTKEDKVPPTADKPRTRGRPRKEAEKGRRDDSPPPTRKRRGKFKVHIN